MGKYCDDAIIPNELRRSFDVYDRVSELGIDLKSQAEIVTSLAGRNIAGAAFHESGLVYLSGIGIGDMQMSVDPDVVAHEHDAGRQCAEHHIRTLHRASSAAARADATKAHAGAWSED